MALDFSNIDLDLSGGNSWDDMPPLVSSPKNIGIDSITKGIVDLGNAYVNSVGAYYQAKGKVADAKTLQYGSAQTQAYNAGRGAIGIPPSNLLLFGGLGLAAIVLLSGGGRRR